MKRKIQLIAILVIFISSCRAKPTLDRIVIKSNTDTVITKSVDVYVSGFRNGGSDSSTKFIAYWKNGRPIYLRNKDSLGNNVNISNLQVYNGNAFLFGSVSSLKGAKPAIWHEGNERIMEGFTYNNVLYSNGAFGSDGSALFIAQENATESRPKPAYWKDGNKINLMEPVGYNATAFGISTKDTNIYIFGEAYQIGVNHRVAVNQKMVWKNNIPILLGNDMDILVSRVIKDDIYTIERVIGDGDAMEERFAIKKNGKILKKFDFDRYGFTPYCIDVNDGNIFVGGNIISNPNSDKRYLINPNCKAAYFKNDEFVVVGNFMKLCDLRVNQHNVYITAIKFLMEKETLNKGGLYGLSAYNVPQQLLLLKDSSEIKQLTKPMDAILINPNIQFNN